MDSVRLCPNCISELHGRFCSACGQDQRQSFSTLRDLLRQVFHELTELDGTLAKSLATLLLHPGRMTLDYLEHKRARYMPPFRLYLVVSVVLYFTLGLLTVHGSFSIDLIDDPSPAHTGSVNQAEKSLLEFLDERLDAHADEPIGSTREPIEGPSFGSRVFGHFPEVSFVLLPFAAMFLKVLYFRRRQAFGEHLVTALHIKAGVFVLMILAAALNGLFTLLDAVTGWVPTGYGGIIPLVAMFITTVYVGVSLRVVYRDNVVFCAVRTIIFLAAYLAVAMVGLFAVAVILVL